MRQIRIVIRASFLNCENNRDRSRGDEELRDAERRKRRTLSGYDRRWQLLLSQNHSPLLEHERHRLGVVIRVNTNVLVGHVACPEIYTFGS